ncbi:hypothetical protein ACFO5Q_16385 [Kordiimonas lipolytica]|uniref:Uncharacterized protein n=1 Tax=Kordiimonas lipolytica TaxID=1662421 RepID=A0ABV8UDS7_9PROT|nr:hypothetical protein [Kordiimonas lipolytica]
MKFLKSVEPIHIVLLLLLVIAGITGFVLMSEPPVDATGVAHATIPAMSVGGDGASKLATIGKAPFYFQIAVILLAGALLYMGVAPHKRDRTLLLFFAGGVGFALFVWVMLFTGYEHYILTGETTVFLGFPMPTNWMFWGIWGSFAAFDLFYVIFFRRYFFTPDEEAEFDALVEELKSERGDA